MHACSQPAFHSPVALNAHSHLVSFSKGTKYQQQLRSNRTKSLCASLKPPISENAPTPLHENYPSVFDRLRRRTLRALRGISDAASVAIAHEVGFNIIHATPGSGDVATVNEVSGGIAECGLMLGGIIGIWTACLCLERMQAIARIRQESFLKECSRVVFCEWSNYSSNSSSDGGGGGIGEDVEMVVGWLGELGELSGGKAAERLWGVVKNGSVREKRGLARELVKWPVRSNVVVGILRALRRDADENVRNNARLALTGFQEMGILSGTCNTQVSLNGGRKLRNDMVKRDTRFTMSESPREYLSRIFAEDNIETRKNASARSSRRVSMTKRSKSSIEIKAPILESLRFPEMHTLCIAVGIPLGYEYYCLLTGLHDPLRFLGLGWLFAICGLAIYPKSRSAWKFIERACQDTYKISR